MSHAMNRRHVLAGGLGAAGLLAAGRLGGLASALAAEKPVDRSANAPAAPVAIQRCDSYDPQAIRRGLDEGFRLIGGIDKLVKGKTVTVKMNLTGQVVKMHNLPAWDTFMTHPHMVAALCAALAGAGARQIVLVESFYYADPMEKVLKDAGWDVEAIVSAGEQRVVFENTRNRGQWKGYRRMKVPWGGSLFPSLELNERYEKTDVFVSLAKMKDHNSAGITLCCKNSFGIMPTSLYGDEAPNENSLTARVANIHEAKKSVPAGVPAEIPADKPADKKPWQYRVPRVTADVVGARPIDLSIIEGMHTIAGGEGPWSPKTEPVKPRLLVVGTNPVCTDSITTALMSYDPTADHYKYPFTGENHLKLLAEAGVGTNDPKRIEVRGLTVEQARFPFKKTPFPG